MLNFDYLNSTRLVFGKGMHRQIGQLIAPYSKKVLLHYGGGSIKKSGVYDEIIASLRESGVEFAELGGVQPNPRVELVREGIALCRREKIDFILAVGGGSVIDSAKAIAAGVPYEGDIWDLYLRGEATETVLPIATILTIPAAGSESSNGSVVTDESTQRKLSCNSEKMRPVFSVVNPELFFTLPDNQVANGLCDMMSHIMERYFTNTTHTDLIDGLAESTLKTIMRNGLLLRGNKKNYDAWAEIGLAGNVAHNGLLGLGREEDWACHQMEHELSAIYDVAHGAGLAVMTPAWMKYVYQHNLPMFVQFAVNVMGVEGSFRDQEALVLAAIDKLTDFFRAIGLPTSLGELGIGEENLELMAKKATGEDGGPGYTLGGLKKLGWQDVLAIYRLSL